MQRSTVYCKEFTDVSPQRHRYQCAVERWEVLQMSEQVLGWHEMYAADVVKEMALHTCIQTQRCRPPGCALL